MVHIAKPKDSDNDKDEIEIALSQILVVLICIGEYIPSTKLAPLPGTQNDKKSRWKC